MANVEDREGCRRWAFIPHYMYNLEWDIHGKSKPDSLAIPETPGLAALHRGLLSCRTVSAMR